MAKRVIVLDLDETLVYSFLIKDSYEKYLEYLPSTSYTKIEFSKTKEKMIAIYRPYLFMFLKFLKIYFHFVVLFSFGSRDYVSLVVENIQESLNDSTYFDLVLTRRDCYTSFKTYQVIKHENYVKNELCKKFEIDQNQLTISLFVDDNPCSNVISNGIYSIEAFHPFLDNSLPTPGVVWDLKDIALQQLEYHVRHNFLPTVSEHY